MTNRNHSKRKPHAQARATAVITVSHAPREERRGPVKGWQGLCVSGKRGGPVQRLTMAALTPTISTGQDHATRNQCGNFVSERSHGAREGRLGGPR